MARKGGGAWKVAYADFVTAMMALFMVLWIIGAEQEILEHLQEYFRNPPTPFLERGSGVVMDLDQPSFRTGDTTKEDLFFSHADPQILAGLVNELYRLLNLDPHDENRPVDVTITSDGLRLILFDRSDLPMFEEGGTAFTEWGAFMMQNLSWILARYEFRIIIDGHTGGRSGENGYGAWELSTDRANAVRRSLEHYAVDPGMIDRVSGYGDTRPLDDEEPGALANQRITLSLRLTEPVNLQPDESIYGLTP